MIISKANLQHTGECKPLRLQQVIQRSRSGAYVKNISDVSLFTLCMMFNKNEGKVLSSVVKQVLSTQFLVNKNVTYRHLYWMKKKIKTLLHRMNDCETFKDFKKITRHLNYIHELMTYHYQMII